MSTNFFSTNLGALRAKKGLTQSEIAEIFKIPRTTWSNYEQGRAQPDMILFSEIAAFFGVSMDELLNHDLKLVEDAHLNFSEQTPENTPKSTSNSTSNWPPNAKKYRQWRLSTPQINESGNTLFNPQSEAFKKAVEAIKSEFLAKSEGLEKDLESLRKLVEEMVKK